MTTSGYYRPVNSGTVNGCNGLAKPAATGNRMFRDRIPSVTSGYKYPLVSMAGGEAD